MEPLLIVIYVVIGIVVFLLIREILTWYWKMNAIVYELQAQNDTLENILNELKSSRNRDA